MAEAEVATSEANLEKKDTNKMSQTEDAYAPEEPTPDVSISLLDIQMPETPESTKGQTSDGDTCRLESPKLVKPVLGKLQAKKRLMAFANKFNVLPKLQNKSGLAQSPSLTALKDRLMESKKSSQGESSNGKTKLDAEPVNQFYNRYPIGNRPKKKTEEKILAIEEIRREESKSKMLLAEAMAAANMEEDSYGSRNGQNLLENIKAFRERNKQEDTSLSRKITKSGMESKYSERRRHYDRDDKRDSLSKESKEHSSSKDRLKCRLSQERDQRKRDKEKKDDRDKREDSRAEGSREKRDDGRDKRDAERDKREDTKEKKDSKDKRESLRERRSYSCEKGVECKDRKDKERSRGKEKELIKCTSWAELRKSALTIDEVIDIKRRDYSERPLKNRTAQDYVRYLEQMLMLNDCRLRRCALVAVGLDGPKEYPPESIKATKKGKSQVLYCENPRISLLLSRQQLLQTLTAERREKMREICEATITRVNTEEPEMCPNYRNWYPKMDMSKSNESSQWNSPINVQLPKSKWDSEDDDNVGVEKQQESEAKLNNADLQRQPEEFSSSSSTVDEGQNHDNEKVANRNESTIKEPENDNLPSTSPSLQSAGDEKLASEYEQFMKMVCTDIPLPATSNSPKEFPSKKISAKTPSPLSYHEFNLETTLPEDNSYVFLQHNLLPEKSGKFEESGTAQEKCEEKGKIQHAERMNKATERSSSPLCTVSHIQMQKTKRTKPIDTLDKDDTDDSRSIPSDWENVRIKVERLSDENSESKKIRKKKRQKKMTSSSETSSSSSSSDSEEEARRKKRKRKLLNNNSSSSDSDSSDSSSSSSESSSSDDKRKRKRKKRKRGGRKKRKTRKTSRARKKRRRKVSSESSSSDSDNKRKKRVAISKKTKKLNKFDGKEVNNGTIITAVQKSPLGSSSSGDGELICTQVASKKVKEETKSEAGKRSAEKHIWDKEKELTSVQKSLSKGSEKKNEERYLEEWEMDCMILPQSKEDAAVGSSRSSVSGKMTDTEKESARKVDRKEEKSKKDDYAKAKRSGTNEEMTMSEKLTDEADVKKKKKRDKEKRTGAEFFADWERESERISQHIMQDEMKHSKKSEKQKKGKWGETEFDTLNVPSLTQLEREVSKRQLLADEWEVDSLEAIPDLNHKQKTARSALKKLEKEVKYDKKTDTYIFVEKESARENKKRQQRLCTIKIWEEEQEEGEREEIMLMEQKTKRKRDEWDIEEESYLQEKNRKDNADPSNISVAVPINVPTVLDTWSKTCDGRTTTKDADKSPIKVDGIGKKVKKSRWDMGCQSEEKGGSKTSVMWEDECVEWTKVQKYDARLGDTSLINPDSILPKSAMKDESGHNIDPQGSARKSISTSSGNTDILELFPKKSQDINLLEGSWTPEEHLLSQNKESKNTPHNVSIDNTKEEATTIPLSKDRQTIEQLNELELNVDLTKKNIELYSPSSPAPSQKSEDTETSNDSSSVNLKSQDLLQDGAATDASVKLDEDDICLSNIPLQLSKFRDNKYTSGQGSVTNEGMEHMSNLQSVENVSSNKFDIKSAESSLNEFSLNNPCVDAHNFNSLRMDIFAEYESEVPRNKISANSAEPVATTAGSKGEESIEGKAALKLIPKQLLVRRTMANERPKPKRQSDTAFRESAQHAAAALLTIQKKLLESHGLKNERKESVDPRDDFDLESKKAVPTESSKVEGMPTDSAVPIIDAKLDTKELIDIGASLRPRSKSPSRGKVDYERPAECKAADKSGKSGETKKGRSSKTINENEMQLERRSPTREQRRKSPAKESDKKYGSERKEKRDKERAERKDGKSSKLESGEGRRRSSPQGGRSRRRRSPTPRGSWERERSISGSQSRSWSRSRSKSPRRKEEAAACTSTRERDKRSSRSGEERSGRSKNTDDRRDRSTRSPRSASGSYSKEHSKKHASSGSKGDRDDWYKRKYDGADRDREKEVRPYDPMEMLRERNIDSERHRENRFRAADDTDRQFWQYEAENALREGNESLDSYANGQEIDAEYDERSYYRDESLEREIMEGPLPSASRFRKRRSKSTGRRERQWEKERDSSDLERHGHVGRRSTSGSRLRSPDHGMRMSDRLRSRSLSPGRTRERKDEDDMRKINTCSERDAEIHGNDGMEANPGNFQYPNEGETGNEYYYTENNLTYPPCIDESTTSSPKRLSLDDRLELELGIKKQQECAVATASEYADNFNANVVYPSPPPQQQQLLYRQQPTVLQVGNVLQVVPADFNGVSTAHRDLPSTPIVRGSSQVVRVGNVLQVVPTSLDWSGAPPSSVDQSAGVLYPTTVPQPSPVSSVPISVPVPVPVPMPVPAVPPPMSTVTPISTLSPVPLPLSVPVPVPVPVPIPVAPAAFPRTEVAPPKTPAQPVYNYEVILETRRKEKEERKRLRELRRKEKERRRIERINRRALRLLEKNNPNARQSDVPSLLDRPKVSATMDRSVLKALRDTDEQIDIEDQAAMSEKMEETPTFSAPTEEEDAPAEEDEDEDDEEEPEVDDDEEEEEEPEDEDEEEEDEEDKSMSKMNNRRTEIEDSAVTNDGNKGQEDAEDADWPVLPPAPLKGILIAPGFRKDVVISNGSLDDLSNPEDDSGDTSDKEDTESDKNNELSKEDSSAESKSSKSKNQLRPKSMLIKLLKRRRRSKKSVQFADGIKPGEGTSPSGGEGDMPSPPPPLTTTSRDGIRELRRSNSRKSRKQDKRQRPPKTKKKVKVKIIKLKKPRITPLTAMMMDDSDELDDRSPPPPPPGSPPPPHLWPSYLSAYNTTMRPADNQTPTAPAATSVQPPPPPTPLPLLVPPPPLNYTIQPCSKA
ncbi:hypothetical protein KM043_009056 [Ampulex compressa]|nr:hypothetical protein KM043_009056 [Ampulex compressa]